MHKFVIGYQNLNASRCDIQLTLVECKHDCHVYAIAEYLMNMYSHEPEYCREIEKWLKFADNSDYNIHNLCAKFISDDECLSILKIQS